MQPGPRMGRRALASLLVAAAASPARAEAADLVVTCDTALGAPLRRAGAAYTALTGARIFVFPTGPGLILPQLQRDIQNDIVVTQLAILDRIVAAGLAPEIHGSSWRNALVLAARSGVSTEPQSIAAPDPTPASDFDGPAVLARLGLRPPRLLGAVDTDEVAQLVATDVVQAGLLHMSDVRADARLAVLRSVPAEIAPSPVYAATATRLARRPDPDAFVRFLASPEATAVLIAAGLEMAQS
jgi:molybdate transport system substrate-binding protein